VTTLASINGRGAYARMSAREEMAGLGPNARYGRARSAVRGEGMATRTRRNPAKRAPTAAEQRAYERRYGRVFKKASTAKRKTTARRAAAKPKVSAKAEQKRRSQRETAFRRAKRSGLSETVAAKRAMREVPFLKGQKSRTFHGQKAYTGKATKKALPKQYAIGKKTVKRKVTTTRAVPVKTRQRVAYGRFKRLKVRDPRTGRTKLSYFYKDSKGKRRKIPQWAIAGAPSAKAYKDGKYDKSRSRIRKRRASTARRVMKSGGAFTPNRKKKVMKKRKSPKRVAAGKKAAATRKRRATLRRNAARKGAKRVTRRRKSPARKKTTARKRTTARKTVRRKAVRRNAKTVRRNAKTTARKTVRRNTRRRATMTANRRKDPKRVRAGKLAWKRRLARSRAGIGRGRGRGGVALARGKVYYKGRKPKRLRGIKARKMPKARVYLTNRRRKTTRRRSYSRNQFMAVLKQGFRSAIFVTTGFVGHKVLTHGLCDKVLLPMLTPAPAAPAAGFGQTGGNAAIRHLVPVACGGAVAAIGTWLASKATTRQRTVEIGAGMFTSWLHTSIVAALDWAAEGDAASPMAEARNWIAGYDTASTAAAIGQYRRRRAVRGFGAVDRRTSSVLPHYTPTGMPGGIQQAVAMAGGGRGTGEYFQASGMGEYFAASGVQGIGQYEPAGPLVTQAAAGLGQQIDNGIMPDQADAALTLAEAQAGTGRLGEYYSAKPKNGDWQEYRVPTSSTWVPGTTAGELWSGTKSAQDALQTSEVPAGVLESASGNGIF